jgi:hypothetical protein
MPFLAQAELGEGRSPLSARFLGRAWLDWLAG